jgi:hypothetical protein
MRPSGFAVTLLSLAIPAASGAAESESIDCRHSYVAFSAPGEYRCSKSPMVSFEGGGGFQGFNLSGRTADGYGVSIRAFRAMSSGSYIRLSNLDQTGDLEQIKNFNKVTREGRNWSQPRHASGVTMAEFESASGSRCSGFFQRGGTSENGRGYLWRVVGEFCAPKGKKMDEAQGDMLFARIAVR